VGQWTRIWDEGSQTWADVFIADWPQIIQRGAASPLPPEKKPTLLGPDGKPLSDPPRRRIGFAPPSQTDDLA
jgi:hypothetical protein